MGERQRPAVRQQLAAGHATPTQATRDLEGRDRGERRRRSPCACSERRARAQRRRGSAISTGSQKAASSRNSSQTPLERGARASRAAASTKRFAIEQRAQHHAEVAEVRQPDARTRLIYTRHVTHLAIAAASMQQDDKPGGAATGKAWSGRFAEPLDAPHPALQRLGRLRPAPGRVRHPGLARARAHARAREHHLPPPTSPRSSAAWRRSSTRCAPARFPWSIEREDVHLNIEHRLTELVGDAGKRLHTARSRNDQVATDMRLWLRAEIDALAGLLRARARSAARPRRAARRRR